MKDDWDIFDNEIQKAMIRARRISQENVKPYIKKLAIYERALEMACEELENDFGHYEPFYKNYFLQQAKQELEEQDGNN